MDNGYFASWAARVEYEANERERSRQEQLLDDILGDEYVNGQGHLRNEAPNKQSKPAKGAARWRTIGLRGVLARLL